MANNWKSEVIHQWAHMGRRRDTLLHALATSSQMWLSTFIGVQQLNAADIVVKEGRLSRRDAGLARDVIRDPAAKKQAKKLLHLMSKILHKLETLTYLFKGLGAELQQAAELKSATFDFSTQVQYVFANYSPETDIIQELQDAHKDFLERLNGISNSLDPTNRIIIGITTRTPAVTQLTAKFSITVLCLLFQFFCIMRALVMGCGMDLDENGLVTHLLEQARRYGVSWGIQNEWIQHAVLWLSYHRYVLSKQLVGVDPEPQWVVNKQAWGPKAAVHAWLSSQILRLQGVNQSPTAFQSTIHAGETAVKVMIAYFTASQFKQEFTYQLIMMFLGYATLQTIPFMFKMVMTIMGRTAAKLGQKIIYTTDAADMIDSIIDHNITNVVAAPPQSSTSKIEGHAHTVRTRTRRGKLGK